MRIQLQESAMWHAPMHAPCILQHDGRAAAPGALRESGPAVAVRADARRAYGSPVIGHRTRYARRGELVGAAVTKNEPSRTIPSI